MSPQSPASDFEGLRRLWPVLSLACGIGCGAPVGSYIPAGYHPDTLHRLIFLGDSITAEYDASPISLELSYPSLILATDRETRGEVFWPGSDDRNLYAHFPELEGSHNIAFPGAVSADLDAQVGDVLKQIDHIEGRVPFGAGPGEPADRTGQTVVLVTIGGNDSQDLLSMAGGANMMTGHGRRLGARIGAHLQRTLNQLEVAFPDGV